MPSLVNLEEAQVSDPQELKNGHHEDVSVLKPVQSTNESTDLEKDEDKSNSKTAETPENEASGTITVYLQIPGVSENVPVLLSLQDTVQDLRQAVMEKPESCYKTCFSLLINGVRLDDFAELHAVEGIKDECVVKVVEEPYSVREARIHVRRLRDLLNTSLQLNAYTAVDNLSLSFLSTVTGVDVEEEAVKMKGEKEATVSTEDCLPPSSVLPQGSSAPLEPLIPCGTDSKLPQCLKELKPSAWNPPPGNRKLKGDLMYFDITTLEDNHIKVTASTCGFFINKSHDNIFDPNPHNEPCRSHSLVGLLNQISPLFRKNFIQLQKVSIKKHPLEVLPTPYQVFPWAIPETDHTQDWLRAEDSSVARVGYEDHLPGQLRDWNEELQSARELPKDTAQQRLLRNRALFKINSDFVIAATKGAMAVVDGNVQAINPGEEEKMRMFIWNDIFFSFAFDSRGHYKKFGGDAASHTAAGSDLNGVIAYNRLDLEGLFTLGTVIVDYRGHRVVAQSIIPGILQREQENSVVYGSIDSGETVSTEPKFLELLKKAGKSLRIRSHCVNNDKGEEVELCSSVECKGIIGADGRHYILDLFRTFPPDVNYLDVGQKDNEERKNKGFPIEYKHTLCTLRPELIDAFITCRYVLFLKMVAMHVNQAREKKMEEERKKEEEKKELKEAEESEKSTDNNETEKEHVENVVNGESTETDKTPVQIEDKKEINDNEKTTIENGEKTQEVSNNNDSDENTSKPDINGLFQQVNATQTAAVEGAVQLGVDPETSAEAFRCAAKAVGSSSLTEFDIRFNPDVHMPGVQHSQSLTDDLALDKLLTQDACDFLVESIIPKIVEEFISLTVSPLDGNQLTEAMHNRGINMRYLGKLASFLSTREDLQHVYIIAVSEMIVRAAKSVFRTHIQGVSLRMVSAAVSHFLNCFLSSYGHPEPHIPPDEFLHAANKKKKNKKKSSKTASTNGVGWASLTPDEMWSSITATVKSQYNFDLEGSSSDSVFEKYGMQRISVLRTFCIKTGVQMLLRDYDFENKRHTTFTENDIMNILPVVKHTNHRALEAAALFDAAQGRLQAGLLGEAHDLMVEALNTFNQIYGPLHADIAVCYRAIARVHYLAEDPAQAVNFQKKAVIVSERVYGIDHPETIVAYVHLALYCHSASLVEPALKLMYRARYLALIVYGEGHPDMATFDSNIGLILHGQREFKMSEQFLQKALDVQLKFHGPQSIHTAMSHHLLARAKACVGDYRGALQQEKLAYNIYNSKLGEADAHTRESSEFLNKWTQQAVLFQKTLNEIASKGVPAKPAIEAKKLHNAETTLPDNTDPENISQLMGYLSGLSPAKRDQLITNTPITKSNSDMDKNLTLD